MKDSKEFLAEDHDIEDLLKILYKAFMDREPDPAGMKYWTDGWEAAADKDAFKSWMIRHFIGSSEFTKIVADIGL